MAFCTQCSAALPDNAKFCSQCGNCVAAKKTKLSSKHILTIVGVALLVTIPAWYFQDYKTGAIPTQTVVPQAEGHGSEITDPVLQPLQAAAEKNPTDMQAQTAYAAALVEKLRTDDQPPQALVLTAVEQLSRVLSLNPLDAEALIALADITFNQQVFNKAVNLYARYLSLKPSDEEIRARYGSALMFTGKFDDAEKELKTVLTKNPKNFQASAYLAITYAQKGDFVTAKKIGTQTLKLAPSDEARSRFEKFLKSLEENKATATTAKASQKGEPVAVQGSPEQQLREALETNSVAGDKFVDPKVTPNEKAEIYFKNFPMQAMPPFAKDKFMTRLMPAALALKVKELVFIDMANGEVMHRELVK